MSGTVTKVSGPLVVAKGLADANVSDVVRVGKQRLIGEILNMTGDSASIQVYEETSGLGPGAEVVTTGMPMSVELGPGMLDNIYDGIQRPLPEIKALAGDTITRGTDVPALNREKKWDFIPVAKVGTGRRPRRRAGHSTGDHRHTPQDNGPQRRQGHR
jgi:V/A-type H+-transporting ATPase subunit A